MKKTEEPSAIGHRIRCLRLQQNRTLDDVAKRCEFTKSLLSKIENGRTVPPVATLSRIAAALGVPVGRLLEDPNHAMTVYTPRAARTSAQSFVTDAGYSFYSFAGERDGKAMQPFLFSGTKGQATPKVLKHSGEEFVYVLSGQLRFRVGAVEYSLDTGDSLYFDAETEHAVTPISETATWMAVFVERTAGAKQLKSTTRKRAPKPRAKE